jgi:hypothetical protein
MTIMIYETHSESKQRLGAMTIMIYETHSESKHKRVKIN